jgi:hypothetical protein
VYDHFSFLASVQSYLNLAGVLLQKAILVRANMQ